MTNITTSFDPHLEDTRKKFNPSTQTMLANAEEAIYSRKVAGGRVGTRLEWVDDFGRVSITDNSAGIPAGI